MDGVFSTPSSINVVKRDFHRYVKIFVPSVIISPSYYTPGTRDRIVFLFFVFFNLAKYSNLYFSSKIMFESLISRRINRFIYSGDSWNKKVNCPSLYYPATQTTGQSPRSSERTFIFSASDATFRKYIDHSKTVLFGFARFIFFVWFFRAAPIRDSRSAPRNYSPASFSKYGTCIYVNCGYRL